MLLNYLTKHLKVNFLLRKIIRDIFVSKTGISRVSNTLNLLGKREALFHELGCLLDGI
ncbi:MAG: hypothetical protein RLZZ338_2359 [Cyanobacteriota bacterium]|jgi:hypothetical protein